MQLKSDKIGEEGRKFWRCSSFYGKLGTEIEGRMFTPITPHRGSTKPYNIKRRKKPKERPMLCTDIRIKAGEPELAFIKAWNRLVDEKEGYMPEWQQAINGENLLRAYRVKEIMRLVEEKGYIDVMPYGLTLKTLDNIAIGMDGKLEIIFSGRDRGVSYTSF